MRKMNKMENNTNTIPNNRTGLWVRESKSGNKFMSGNLKIGDKEYNIRIFKNDRKETNKQPDYTMFYDLKEGKKDTPASQEKNEVVLTDEDYDKMLGTNEVKDEQLELPF